MMIYCPFGDWSGDEALFREHMLSIHSIDLAEHIREVKW